jgi:predicted nuclease of predicted toxin-antitoxin system
MRLLFDQNLSPYLPERLSDVYPNSKHVMDEGLERALDADIWEYAKQEDLTIVTKDADFSEWSLLRGVPPNVVWIRRGNCSMQDIEQLLRTNEEALENLYASDESGVVELH